MHFQALSSSFFGKFGDHICFRINVCINIAWFENVDLDLFRAFSVSFQDFAEVMCHVSLSA